LKLHLAIPVLNEYKNLSKLIESLRNQNFKNFDCIICVNQNDSWWQMPDKQSECINNQKSIQYLKARSDLDIKIIDRSSKGLGWKGKKGGVGWARKTAMDQINDNADPDDVIVSMDADTFYPENYLEAIVDSFIEYPKSIGLAVPYYHKLNGGETDPLILRYEIYMRYYLLNMLRINSPYSFTAIGSAMAFPVWAYRKVDGLTPFKSGEDFYFLQKIAKTGSLLIWTDTVAYPSSRFSERVFFGTGPALIKGRQGDWSSYPFYNAVDFDKVKETFDMFPDLYHHDLRTPMDEFLKQQFNAEDLWSPLRKNNRSAKNFVTACIMKVDSLRILQFLKTRYKEVAVVESINQSVKNNIESVLTAENVFPKTLIKIEDTDTSHLISIRELLFKQEQLFRRQTLFTGIKKQPA